MLRLPLPPGALNATAAADWLTWIPGRPKYIVCDGTKL